MPRDSCRQLPPYRDVRRPPADFLRHRTDDLACPPQWDLDCSKVAGKPTVSLDVGWHPSWLGDPRSGSFLCLTYGVYADDLIREHPDARLEVILRREGFGVELASDT